MRWWATWLISICMNKDRIYNRYVKRALDLLLGGIAFVIASPVLLLAMGLLKIANKGAGVFFLQPRPGLHGTIFHIIKFILSDKSI